MQRFPFQTGFSIVLVAPLLACAHWAFPKIRAPQPAQFAELLDFRPGRTPVWPLRRHVESALAPTAVVPAKTMAPSALLEDSGHSLDRFYQALWRTENRETGAVTRIVHYGDSPTTADLITGDVRAILQQRYGDAGHGFILVSKPWAWYRHKDVVLFASGWQAVPAS